MSVPLGLGGEENEGQKEESARVQTLALIPPPLLFTPSLHFFRDDRRENRSAGKLSH